MSSDHQNGQSSDIKSNKKHKDKKGKKSKHKHSHKLPKKKKTKAAIHDYSRRSSSFVTDQERQSFNAMISLRDPEKPPILTTEHKVCAIMTLIVSILILIMLSYGQLSSWSHSTYIIDPIDNVTKIYNSSWTVKCSWHSYHKTVYEPYQETIEETYHQLCKENVSTSCQFNSSGKTWFALLFITMIFLIISTMLLLKPEIFDDCIWKNIQENNNRKCCKCKKRIFVLKYIHWILVLCGLFCLISIIPIASVMGQENDICGDNDYSEWGNDYDGEIDNLDEPLWTIYISPVIGIFLWLSACFISKIKIKPDIPNLFNNDNNQI